MKSFKLVSWLNHIELLLRLTWKKIEIFVFFYDSLVHVDADELNVVLSSNGQENIDEDDDIHIEDCDEGDDYSIDEEEEENSD
jgi:hypothetical protein